MSSTNRTIECQGQLNGLAEVVGVTRNRIGVHRQIGYRDLRNENWGLCCACTGANATKRANKTEALDPKASQEVFPLLQTKRTASDRR